MNIVQTLKYAVNAAPKNDSHVVRIRPNSGWELINLREIVQYRDLMFFLIRRDIKVLYAQTVLGFLWVILQPLMELIIFSFIFGRVANVPTEGIPYVLFASVGTIPWAYMSQSMLVSSQSLISGQSLIEKVYFPRLLFPLVPVIAKLLDFAISMLIIVGIMIYFHVSPTWNMIFFPFFVFLMMSTTAAVGIWSASMALRYRDVKHALPFLIRMLMFSAPIVYSASSIPDSYRLIYSLNPIVSVIEGLRGCLLGTRIPWEFVWPGAAISIGMLFIGAFYFRRMEKYFADVI